MVLGARRWPKRCRKSDEPTTRRKLPRSEQLRVGAGIMPPGGGAAILGYGSKQFSDDAIESLPELREDLEYERDLLHPQISILASTLRHAVDAGDSALPQKICTFLERALSKQGAVAEIENAIAISFVQPFELRKTPTGRFVLRTMPASVRRIILDQEERSGVW